MIILRDKLFVAASYKKHKQKKEADLKRAEQKLNQYNKRLKKAQSDVENIKPVKNPKVERNLVRQAVSEGATLVRDKGGLLGDKNNRTSCSAGRLDKTQGYLQATCIGKAPKMIKDPDIRKDASKLSRARRDGKSHGIRYPEGAGIESLAHEIGHVQEDKAGREKVGRNIVDHQKLVHKNEKAASHNAISNLKNAGANKKEIKQSKSNLSRFEKTYRNEKQVKRYERKLGKIDDWGNPTE